MRNYKIREYKENVLNKITNIDGERVYPNCLLFKKINDIINVNLRENPEMTMNELFKKYYHLTTIENCQDNYDIYHIFSSSFPNKCNMEIINTEFYKNLQILQHETTNLYKKIEF
jgi:hypothetical protein